MLQTRGSLRRLVTNLRKSSSSRSRLVHWQYPRVWSCAPTIGLKSASHQPYLPKQMAVIAQHRLNQTSFSNHPASSQSSQSTNNTDKVSWASVISSSCPDTLRSSLWIKWIKWTKSTRVRVVCNSIDTVTVHSIKVAAAAERLTLSGGSRTIHRAKPWIWWTTLSWVLPSVGPSGDRKTTSRQLQDDFKTISNNLLNLNLLSLLL